jgi:hypothetical protein
MFNSCIVVLGITERNFQGEWGISGVRDSIEKILDSITFKI